MPGAFQKPLRLFREFRRRHVFRVAAAYLIAAWVVLEVTDVLVPALHLPEWGVTMVAVLGILGFPIAVALAWAYDLTPDGVVRTPSSPDGTESDVPAAASAAAGAAGAARGAGGPRADAVPGERTIAVLPFVNMTGDDDIEYFCDGMTEELINALVNAAGVRVAARTSSFAFKGRNMDVRELGRQLDVGSVVEGSVRRAGDRLRITAQLIEVGTGFHLWSDRYDRTLEDVFVIQDEIATAIAATLRPHLAGGAGAAPLLRPGTTSTDAYHEYLKGRHFWYQRQLQKAIEHFGSAVRLDPEYARAWAGIADSYSFLGFYGFVSSTEARAKAQAAAIRAVTCGPDVAETHYALGLVEFLFGWDESVVEREFGQAAALNPGLAMPHAQLCQHHASRARPEEADAAAARALELEPLAPLVHATIGFAYVFLRRYEQAIAACRTALELDPHALPAVWVMGVALSGLGRHEQAVAVLENAVAATQRNGFMLMWLGGAYAAAGRADDARAVLAELDEREAAGAVVLPACRAWIHAHLGEAEQALPLLDEAFAQRNTQATFFAFFPIGELADHAVLLDVLDRGGMGDVRRRWQAVVPAVATAGRSSAL